MPNTYNDLTYSIFDTVRPLKAFLPQGTYPLNNNEMMRPFFIIGSGRSGNTLLRRLLMESKDVYIPPETYVLGGVIRNYRKARHLGWVDIVNLALSQIEYHPEFETFGIDSLRALAIELYEVPSPDRSLARILNDFYLFCAKSVGRQPAIWGDKTPINTYSMKRIHRVFPELKAIHILRDGCDVVASYVASGIYSDLTSAANRWVTSSIAADEYVAEHPHSSMTIRYEDLVSDTERYMKEIFEFLGVDLRSVKVAPLAMDDLGDVIMRKHHQRVMEPVDVRSIGKGRNNLTPIQKNELAPIMDRQLQRFGYLKCMS